MPLVLAYEDAKTNQIRGEGDGSHAKGGFVQTPFFGSRDRPELPHANLNRRDPGRTSRTHYHISDQFQVVVDGKGTLGRHSVGAYCVHFARAYTPYGPLGSDPVTALTALALRAHYDPGAQRLPQKLEQLRQVPDRQPWQITRSVAFPTPQWDVVTTDAVLQAVPGMQDEHGLAAYTLSVKPNGRASAPDPSYGDGQYLIVLRGSLIADKKEHKALTLVFVFPHERRVELVAGSMGLDALILNFPTRERVIHKREVADTTAGLKTWQCSLCAFAYSEAAGLPEDGIVAGTRWADVPETWSCPDCGASKPDFKMIER